VVWGFVGPKHARFSDFIYDPATTFYYVRDLLQLRGHRYFGHSPGGGYMVICASRLFGGNGSYRPLGLRWGTASWTPCRHAEQRHRRVN
jgi:cytochrome b